MGKKLNKRDLIKETINGIETQVSSDYNISEKEFKVFSKEIKKIVSNYIKTYNYDIDMCGNECIDDYSYFQEDLMTIIYNNTSFFKK